MCRTIGLQGATQKTFYFTLCISTILLAELHADAGRALALRALGRHPDHAARDRQLLERVQELVGLDPKRWSPKAIRAEMSNAKNQLVSAEAANLLVDEHGFTIEDAFVFLSVACDAGVAQACKPAEGFGASARFSIPKLEACPAPFRA